MTDAASRYGGDMSCVFCAIVAGQADLALGGGVESMTRAPFVMGKADSAFSRTAVLEDTTLGWRLINLAMRKAYGVDSMPETAENVAREYEIGRADQDAFALRSQMRTKAAIDRGRGVLSPGESEPPHHGLRKAELDRRQWT